MTEKELYKKNLNAIPRTSDFRKWIETDPAKDWIEIKSGKEPNLLIKKRNRVQTAYPTGYKKELAALAKSKIFHSDTATIIIGMGLGGLVHAALKGMEDGHRVVVVEPIGQLIREAFRLRDFSKWIRTTELIIIKTKADISNTITMLDGTLVIQDWLTLLEPYVSWCEEYSELSSYANEILDQHRCGIGTVMGAGPIIAENDIKNIPFVITDRGVKDLKDVYRGRPAVSVATGPSLEKNIHHLKAVQDRVVIITVAQALRILLAHDIRPDFITTVDYGEVNLEHFRGLMDTDIPLVALNRTYAPILEQWQGPKFIVGTQVPGYESTAHGLIEDKGFLEQGGSVVHLSYQLARHLGCNPIILMGHNQAYENGFSHTPQVDAGGTVTVDDEGGITWNVQDPRSILKDEKHYQGGVVMVPGYFGEPVSTNVGLASFITTFEAMFEKDGSEVEVFNCTEGGASIKGAKNITMRKVVDKHIPKIWRTGKRVKKSNGPFWAEVHGHKLSMIAHLLTEDPKAPELVEESIKRLQKDREVLKEIVVDAEKAITAADEMVEAGDDRKLYKKASKINEVHAAAAHDGAKKNPIMALHIYATSRKIYSRDLKVKGTTRNLLKNMEDRKTRVERSKLILNAAKTSAEKLIPMYDEAIERLAEMSLSTVVVGEFPERLKTEKPNLKDAKKYFAAGNWAHPLVDARKLIRDYPLERFDRIKMFFGVGKFRVLKKAYGMRKKSLDSAIENEKAERRQDLLDYREAIDRAREIGRAADSLKGKDKQAEFEKALKILRKGMRIFPERLEARWGYATTLAKLRRESEALEQYEILTERFPENLRLQFEGGLVTSALDLTAGITKIESVMEKTKEFDHFFSGLGDLYLAAGDTLSAAARYEKYLGIYPDDEGVKERLKAIR